MFKIVKKDRAKRTEQNSSNNNYYYHTFYLKLLQCLQTLLHKVISLSITSTEPIDQCILRHSGIKLANAMDYFNIIYLVLRAC